MITKLTALINRIGAQFNNVTLWVSNHISDSTIHYTQNTISIATTQISDYTNSVNYDKIAIDLKSSLAVTTTIIDYSASGLCTVTLLANTIFTISNLQLNKVIVLIAIGDFTIAFPSYVNFINGEYDGTVHNYIKLHCTNATINSEEIWATISQKPT